MVGLGLLLVNRYEKRNSGSIFANSVTVGRTFIGEIVPGFAAYRSGQFQVKAASVLAHTHTHHTGSYAHVNQDF
jgi:hypothetical protein